MISIIGLIVNMFIVTNIIKVKKDAGLVNTGHGAPNMGVCIFQLNGSADDLNLNFFNKNSERRKRLV